MGGAPLMRAMWSKKTTVELSVQLPNGKPHVKYRTLRNTLLYVLEGGHV